MEKDSPFSSTCKRCIVTFMCILVTTLGYAQHQKISVRIKSLRSKKYRSDSREGCYECVISKEFVDT